MRRFLVPSAALLWGLQFAFLNPALALILVALYNATPAQVGWVLAIYNASGFIASLIVPGYADRRHAYLRVMLACGVLTLLLAALLAVTSNLPLVVVGLVVFGGPAGVGSSLLYAHLRDVGASPAAVVNTRAMVSVAWVAGPPVATLIIGVFGNRAILIAIAAVAVINITTTALMVKDSQSPAAAERAAAKPADADQTPVSRSVIALIMVAFVLLQATNATSVSIMNLFVTKTLGLNVFWSGIALGLSAGLEIPALMLIGRLSAKYSSTFLLATGCLAGIAYYTAMAFITGPVLLLALQVLNSWFFAAVAGIGLTVFLQIIPRPGLASGLYTNTRRVGAIVSGAVIALASDTVYGYRGTFIACTALTFLALVITEIAGRRSKAV